MAPSDSFFQQVFIEFCNITDGGDTDIQRNGPCRRESSKLVGGHTKPLEHNISGDKVKSTVGGLEASRDCALREAAGKTLRRT